MSIRTEVGGILQEQLPGPLSRHAGEGRPESGQPHLVGEDFYQDPVFPQPVPQEKLVLCAHGHVLADSNHPVVSKHCRYVLTQELDEARLLWQDGVRRYEDLRVPSPPHTGTVVGSGARMHRTGGQAGQPGLGPTMWNTSHHTLSASTGEPQASESEFANLRAPALLQTPWQAACDHS